MKSDKIDVIPPEGMRTVMCNNEPVGYVKETGEPETDVKLAKELLIEKGLWRDTSTTEAMFGIASSFAHTAKYIYEKDLMSLPRNARGLSPFIVNASFSAEMYLKCLLKIHDTTIQTHVLTTLFKQLPNILKNKIHKKKQELETKFDVNQNLIFRKHLEQINNAFVTWRYIYEKQGEQIHIPTVIFVLQVLHEVTVNEFKSKA
ncbi:hypothetical protein [Desulfoluna spongiiphila]|uniref:hypothetical protein n=1 Tax=Desulfoluna spongiiphila TaxID=419481 RepID=UPI00125F4CEA|nr:hypothetical protein [Desulfoluna spongiiphila]